VRVYIDGFFRGASYIEDEYAGKAVEAVQQGFTALKMDVDVPIPMGRRFNRSLLAADLRHCVKMVESVRNAVGPDVDLAIDAHGAFDVPAATRLGKALEHLNLMWIEDPVPMQNLEAMARVAAEVETPICTGELLDTRFAFRELFAKHAADIIMPDVARTGGVLEMKKIAAMADAHLIPFAPHNMVGPVATIAAMHVCAATPNFLVLEYQLGDVEWIDELITRPVPIRDGHLEPYDAPGLGVALNHTALERYRAG
jgi:L-alanine-DL-glutamate epimerase-like enolase superfamily enzyme